MNKAEYEKEEAFLADMLQQYPGEAELIIYCKQENARKYYGQRNKIAISEELMKKLEEKYQRENVKVVEKSIEKL